MTEHSGYEILEHTADKGVRAWGRTLEELFENAARGMYRLVVDPAGKKTDVSMPVAVEVSDPFDRSDLLVKWLRELIPDRCAEGGFHRFHRTSGYRDFCRGRSAGIYGGG